MKSVTVIKDENLKNLTAIKSSGNMTKVCMFLAQLTTIIKCPIFKSLYVLDAFFNQRNFQIFIFFKPHVFYNTKIVQ